MLTTTDFPMINTTNFIKLVADNADKKQFDGFVCVGYGINIQIYDVEVPFSIIDLLGIDYKELYSPTFSDDELVAGFYGATVDYLYYITVDKFNQILNRSID